MGLRAALVQDPGDESAAAFSGQRGVSLGLSSTGGDRLVSVTRKVLLTSDDWTC